MWHTISRSDSVESQSLRVRDRVRVRVRVTVRVAVRVPNLKHLGYAILGEPPRRCSPHAGARPPRTCCAAMGRPDVRRRPAVSAGCAWPSGGAYLLTAAGRKGRGAPSPASSARSLSTCTVPQARVTCGVLHMQGKCTGRAHHFNVGGQLPRRGPRRPPSPAVRLPPQHHRSAQPQQPAGVKRLSGRW